MPRKAARVQGLRCRFAADSIQGIRIFLAEGEQCGVDGGINQLQAGALPVLAQRGAEGEQKDRERGGDESEARREAKQDQQAEHGLHPWQREAEGQDGPRGQGRGMEEANQRRGEGMRAGEQPADAVDSKVDANDGAQQRIGEPAVQLLVCNFMGGCQCSLPGFAAHLNRPAA